MKWFEGLVGDSLGDDFARRHMTLGPVALPPSGNDVQLIHRLGLFARAYVEYGLRVASLFVDAEWINSLIWPYERDKFHAIAHFLKGCGSEYLICGGGPPAREKLHSDKDYELLRTKVEEIGAYTKKLGLRTVFHPHVDCFIETHEQLDRFMHVLDTDLVGLCIDPAHFQVSGDEPVDVIHSYIEDIDYFHFKDVKGDVSKMEGFDRYLAFCEVGSGQINFPAITDILLRNNFDGMVIIEQDYSNNPEESCIQSVKYMAEELGLNLNKP